MLYQRWSQAEAAAEALNGKTGQLLGQTRPLVVHFANPRRNPSGPSEPGIAPRKLFIGQVRTCQCPVLAPTLPLEELVRCQLALRRGSCWARRGPWWCSLPSAGETLRALQSLASPRESCSSARSELKHLRSLLALHICTRICLTCWA